MENQQQSGISQQLMQAIVEIEETKQVGNTAYSDSDFKTAALNYSRAIHLYLAIAEPNSSRRAVDRRTMEFTTSQDPFSAISSAIADTFTNAMAALDPSRSPLQENAHSSSNLMPDAEVRTSSPIMTSNEQEVRARLKVFEQVKPHVLYSNRSATFMNLHRFDDALEDALLAINANPEWPKGYYRKAEALISLRRYEEALPALYRALERFEKHGKSTDLIESRLAYASSCMRDQARSIRIFQMLSGRDFAVSSWSPISQMIFGYAKMMRNHVYAICCEREKKCVLVDACWDVDGIVDCVKKAGYQIVGAIVTHYHFDHVGGKPPKPYDQYRIKVDGIEKLLRIFPNIKVHIHSNDIAEVVESTGISSDRIEPTFNGFEMKVGSSASLRFMHTPGHTPGSQCVLVNGDRLISGDTMFIGGVGRLDFPDSDLELMYSSLKSLRNLEDNVVVYPGHDYGGSYTTIAREKRFNPAFRASNFNQFFVSVSGG